MGMRSIRMVFLLLPIFLLFSGSLVNAQFFEAGVEELKVPAEAPDFNLRVIGDGTIGLKDLKGKVAVLTFIEDWCSVCKKDAASLDKLARATKNRDVVFLLVAVNWRKNEIVKFKKEFSISSPVLIDETGSVPKAYNISGYPETIFINPKGRIVGKTFAKEKWDTTNMKNLLQHLLAADRIKNK
jgi:peroxiredoxin